MLPAQRARRRRGGWMLASAIALYFPAMLMVLAPLASRQFHAFISLFWAIAYMASGAMLGLRMYLTGLVTAVAIVVGYLFVTQYYFLWMAVFGGGSLILAGLWLRRA
jgi:hypothetical protein